MKYFELYKSIYNELNYKYKNYKELEEIIQKDIKKGYLTINKGVDNYEYIWYMDENNNLAINLETKELITDEKKLQKIFNY